MISILWKNYSFHSINLGQNKEEYYEEKRKQFDLDLEQETQAHLQKIREALEADTQTLLDQQAESNDSCVLALKKEYESRHTLYAQEILKRITEV